MCRYVGAGMQSFAVSLVSPCKNLKGSSMMGRVLLTFLFTIIIERVSASAPPSPWNLSAYWPWVATMPSKPVRKSTCQKARRNSPSVTERRPAASCIATALRISRSSISLSRGDLSARALRSSAGRRRLPTWSARKGGRMAKAYSGNKSNSKVSAQGGKPPWRAMTPLVEGEGFVAGSFQVADVARKNLRAVLLEQVRAQPHVVTNASPRYPPVERNPPLAGFDQVDHSQGKHAVRHSRLPLSSAQGAAIMLPAMTANPLDLRSWLDEIRELGELKEVRGADWNLELGAISELNVKKDSPPALLFDEIAGYPKGFRVLTCSTSSPARLSSILRFGLQRTHRGLVEALRGKPAQWQADAPKYDPVAVKSGAVLENIQKEADVLAFPSPRWHELDAGRYSRTGREAVTRDFDSDWTNVGTYRVMVVDKNHVALDMVPGKHGRIHYEKHKQAGKRFPVAIVAGGDPLGYLISGIEVPFGMCEWNYIGAILKNPVCVLKGEVTGLPFPSASEIVLEGFVEPNDERTEGPFGEFHGYYPGKAGTAPVVTIQRAYFRDNPILMGSPPAKPPNDYSYSKAVMRSALLHDALVAAGVPDVRAVWAHEIGGARMFNVGSIKQRYAGRARQAGHILNQCGVGAYMSRYSVVVDDDIDPSNLQEVMWAVATRTDPALDIDIIQRGMGSKNDPMYVAYPYAAPLSSKAIIDACRPWDHLDEFPAVAEASKELQDTIRQKWKGIL